MIADPYDLNFRHLVALIAVCDGGSISAGSRLTCLSQSALTQGIAKIERQLECVLFVRKANGIEVTPEGEMALQRVRAALGYFGDAIRNLGGDAQASSRSITMTHIRALVSLGDARSFMSAAAAVNLSTTSVHRAVGELENHVGKRLVDRGGQGTLLNFSGRRLARGFRLAVGELRAMVGEIRDDARVVPISIGAMPIARPFIVPTAIARFVEAHPPTRFKVAEGDWQDLIEQLQDGVVDLIIGVIRDNKVSNLVQEPLSDDHVVVLCGSHHPLANQPAASLSDMAGYPWVVSPPLTPLRMQWEALFANHPRPECPVECESIMVVINLLAQSHFLTLASPRQVELPMQTKRLAQVGSFVQTSTRAVGLITRKDWRPTPIERQFMETLATVAKMSGAAPIALASGGMQALAE